MITIYAGSNDPILLKFSSDLSDMVEFSATLSQRGTTKKKWDLSLIEIKNDIIKLPLTEEDTFSLSRGIAHLDVKCLNSSNQIKLYKTTEILVIDTNNLIRLVNEDNTPTAIVNVKQLDGGSATSIEVKEINGGSATSIEVKEINGGSAFEK